MTARTRCMWQQTKWGNLATLEYGKSLRDYDQEPSEQKPYRVFGTNGPIGWHTSPLCERASVVVGRKGAYRGIHYSPDPFFVIDTAFYLRPKTEFNIRWAYYQLKDFDINKLDSGSAIPSTSREAFYEIPVSLPPLPVQRRIAGILSAYDELIENSQRRIKILEAMARALYREWFVHFRFPGHENHSRVASPLGEIPNGWEVEKLKDVCRLTMGQSPKSEFYNQTGEGQPFHQGVTDFGDRFPTDRLFCTVEGRIAEAGDILFSVRAPVGRMNIADKKIIIGRGLSAIRRNDGHQAFLWEQLRNRFTEDDMMGNGAIFAAVTKDDMQGIEILGPPQPIVTSAEKHFAPIHDEIGSLTRRIQNLRRTRDLLLPRLLSGQVDFTTEAA